MIAGCESSTAAFGSSDVDMFCVPEVLSGKVCEGWSRFGFAEEATRHAKFDHAIGARECNTSNVLRDCAQSTLIMLIEDLAKLSDKIRGSDCP